ncbi:cation:proton antiporter [Pediococcus pentosaceus]|uniref:cation:proton antiporter n=1 Tax=Pediococcus pentosaceus TaxID=1255 RepID=UPI000CFECEA5|nr:sodium:proton antiporter [Pediococcus pentosaceus]AVL02233.1 peptidase [Pediococcus pentosaceus]MBF7134233.1 sodium:proton antiporter [Pediococcus pentosaceus]MCT3020441.1 sodium:proton antiporter [Pediococcus pentosaceus]MDD1386989.1 sodium:proton antiporter [Pediococcus pentosaceus]QPT36359.1 sodium:proton antiporter [Pediococcus pentosaceus]
MQTFYTIALLLTGVILSNIIKQLVPRIPEAFILIIVGVILSFTPAFHNFELRPEFFMLVVIAPIMFIDGQKQSFNRIRQRFRVVFFLSVVLAGASALVVGILTNNFETKWTLPVAIALAAIVTPTDAVAVKSMTSGTAMPENVNEALELESLFNDATGLVILDLALSVLQNGTFSAITGVEHFIFVALGGVIIGIIAGFLIVSLRVNLNMRANNPETIIIPISLLTPFLVYLLAEHLGTSGILAVVATGMVHNWESERLRLTSTRVQLTSATVWNTISSFLNSVVFLFLGVTLPMVWKDFIQMGTMTIAQLIGISLLIYLSMLAIRYWWSVHENPDNPDHFLGPHDKSVHQLWSRIFAISGVHGTVTLAMAFSLPTRIGGHPFPYREELIVIATLVILISMLVSAISLPLMLPVKTTEYSLADIDHVRNKMVDYATLQLRDTIDDHAVREALTEQLQSQKGALNGQIIDFDEYQELMFETKDFIVTYIHGPSISAKYSLEVVNIYEKILNNFVAPNFNPREHFANRVHYIFKKNFKKVSGLCKHALWHVKNGQITKHQRTVARQKWLAAQPSDTLQQRLDVRDALLELNNEVIDSTDKYLDDVLRGRLLRKQSNNQYINLVRRSINRYCSMVRHDYNKQAVFVSSDLYIQAFQQEYNFIQRGVSRGVITPEMATVLYDEINQAQSLQLQRTQQLQIITS